MPCYKAGKVLEERECEEAYAKADSTFFLPMAALVPTLLKDSPCTVSAT